MRSTLLMAITLVLAAVLVGVIAGTIIGVNDLKNRQTTQGPQ